MTASSAADYVIFVTEPTPFGLHDLSIAVETIQEIGTPFGVVVNRIEEEENMITEYCDKNSIALLLQIKANRKVAESNSRGETLIDAVPEMADQLRDMVDNIKIMDRCYR